MFGLRAIGKRARSGTPESTARKIRGVNLDCGYRIDLLVERKIIEA